MARIDAALFHLGPSDRNAGKSRSLRIAIFGRVFSTQYNHIQVKVADRIAGICRSGWFAGRHGDGHRRHDGGGKRRPRRGRSGHPNDPSVLLFSGTDIRRA
jgi:hypothetical protein